jgi:hypothetical protein
VRGCSLSALIALSSAATARATTTTNRQAGTDFSVTTGRTLHDYGGIIVVQDPRDAASAAMPEAALEKSKPDHIVKPAAMPALLSDLVAKPEGKPATNRDRSN